MAKNIDLLRKDYLECLKFPVGSEDTICNSSKNEIVFRDFTCSVAFGNVEAN